MPASFLSLTGWNDVFHEVLNHLERPVDDVHDNEDYDGEIYRAALSTFRNALLSLALSCRAFLDPSLDKLWHDLHDILPLLELLPNYERRGRVHHLMGEISPGAWLRLRTYANRVRSIALEREATSLDPGVWPALLGQCQGTLFFPNLRELTVSLWAATQESFRPIRCLISPSLRHFCLSIDPGRGEDKAAISTLAQATLQELSDKTPELTHLLFFPYMTIGHEYLQHLAQFPKIERLDLSHRAPVDETLLIRFAKLENLAQLQVTACFPNSTDSPPLDRRHSFQKLTKLELRCQPTGLARFILASTMPRLNDLCLQLDNHFADDFLKHFPSICRHIGPHTLTRLRVELGEIVRPPQLLMDILEPLLPFTKLESLELFFEEHLPLRDADIERLARAWSNQHNLILIQSETTMSDPDRVPGSVERPTLRGLVELARGCPQLSKICIPDLDATSVPPADSVPLTAHGARKLCIQNLVGAGEDETRLAVAVVLDRLFPRLKLEMSGIMEMPGYGDSPNPYVDDSESVTLLLRAMQIARKHYPGGV